MTVSGATPGDESSPDLNSDPSSDPSAVAQRTSWRDQRLTAVRVFAATETASASVLLAATVAALLWANSPWSDAYERLWHTEVAVRVAGRELAMDLQHWINDGLMALFFFVAGLEIRREIDMGDLRERRRVATPVIAAVGGMAVPALIYLAINVGRAERARAGASPWAPTPPSPSPCSDSSAARRRGPGRSCSASWSSTTPSPSPSSRWPTPRTCRSCRCSTRPCSWASCSCSRHAA